MKAFIILSSCVMLAIARPEAGYSYNQPAQQYNVQPASASVSIGSFNGGSSSASYSQQQSAPAVLSSYSSQSAPAVAQQSYSSSSYSQPASSVSVQYQSAPAPVVQQYQPQIISAPAPAPVQYQQQAAPVQQQQQQQTSYSGGSSYGNAGSSYNVGASYSAADSSSGSVNYQQQPQQQQQQQQQSSFGGIAGPSHDEVFSASFNSGSSSAFGNGGGSFGAGSGNFGSGSGSFGSGSSSFGSGSSGFGGSSGEGTTIVQKHIYVHVPPPEQEQVRQQSVQSGSAPAQKHYKIIFIKAPTPQTYSPAAVAAAQANSQEKTIVYVLVKKPEEPTFEASAPNVPIIQPTKPEVYFIKYKAAARDAGASGASGAFGVSGGSGISGGSSIDSISISNPLLDERSNGGGILSGESSSSHGSVVSKPSALYGAVH